MGRGAVTGAMLLMLAVVHAPPPAQALLFDLLPADLALLGSSEPVVLILTGLALIRLGRLTLSRSRAAAEPPVAEERPASPPRPLPSRRAA